MPRYQVTLDGRTFVVEGERPPTEAEARQALQSFLGADEKQADPEPPGRSVGGFLNNVVSSGGKFVSDTATGIWELAKLGGRLAQAQTNPQEAQRLGNDFKSASSDPRWRSKRTALKEGAVTEGLVAKKRKAAAAGTTRAADAATQAGATIQASQIVSFPKTLRDLSDLTPNLRELDELAALEIEAFRSLPSDLTPSELLARRRALDAAVDTAYRAEERGGYVRSVTDKGRKDLARNMRETLRQVAPEVRESDDLARRLGLVENSLKNADERPKTIPMAAALGGGAGAFFFGGPAAGAAVGSIGVGRNWPQIPLALGSLPVRGTGLAATRLAQSAALAARLFGEADPLLQELLMRAMEQAGGK